MQAIKTPKQSLTKTQHSLRVSLPQENHTTCAPCFAEGSSVLAHAKRLEVASPYSSSLRVWYTRCWWNVETFALLATTCITCISPASLPSLGSNTLALGSCLIASKDKAITKATTSGSVITEPITQALRPLRPLRLCVPFSHFWPSRAAVPRPTFARLVTTLAG